MAAGYLRVRHCLGSGGRSSSILTVRPPTRDCGGLVSANVQYSTLNLKTMQLGRFVELLGGIPEAFYPPR
jgi:hypothetical protein